MKPLPGNFSKLSFSGIQKAPRVFTTPFAKRVYDVVGKIPKGETMTYKEVASAAGSPKASRAVGNIMSKNYDPKIPCHRVVRSDGAMGGYNRGGADRKREILTKEGGLSEKKISIGQRASISRGSFRV
jgi:methylated-DNA-[protein]-cysteine S-methyltransferase